MFRTNDIYYKVGKGLVAHDYYQKDINTQKELIELEIKKYIISKLEELNLKASMKLSIYELINLLNQRIDAKDKEKILPHFTHCILNLISDKQNYSVTWYVEDDESLKENPVLNFNENNLCDKLITHINIDYVKVFGFVYYTFKDKMFLKEKQKKLASDS